MKLALVTPWYGADLIGGAERLAWDLSHALARRGNDVDVLTTCCRSFHDDWSANYYRPGINDDAGVTVRRFKVDSRDRVAFSRANSALLALRRDELRRDRPPLAADKTRAFVAESIRSRALLRYLQESKTRYDAFVFLPYLYGLTVQGLPLVAERAFLVPCLHDEAYAYLDEVREVFRKARGLLFNSEGELQVAASLYGPWVRFRSAIIGHAIDVVSPPKEAIAIHGFVPQRSRYVFFLGRGDKTKNVDLALDAFAQFRAMRPKSAMQFVIAGPHATPLHGDGVIDLGAVTEEEKAALLGNARALVQPSTNESFSRTVFEAWQVRRPVVVHGDCAATAQLVIASGGGWTARGVAEWASTFATIDESSDSLVDGLGMRGRAVALRAGTWDDVSARTLSTITEQLAERNEPAIVPLCEWAGPRAPEPHYDDGAINVLSLSPLRGGDVETIAEIFALLRRKALRPRLLVFEEDCSAAERERLETLFGAIGFQDTLVYLGDDPAQRFAALRDAHVACAFGAALERRESVDQAMAFDIPVIAYGEGVSRQTIENSGIICERGSPEEAAALLYLSATDDDLRRSITSGYDRAFRSPRIDIVSTDAVS